VSTSYNDTPLSIDYTSRDYYSIRAELIERIKANISNSGTGVAWTGTDPSDFGVALVDAFSYMGDIINYYIDRVANESYIGTATQRQSLVNLAAAYGYTVSGYRQATADVVFYNSSEEPVVVPVGTQVSGEVTFNDTVQDVIFTVENEVTVPAATGGVPGESEAVTAVHGELVSTRTGNDATYGESLGTSNGLPSQVFVLSEDQVVTNSIQIYVQNGTGVSYEPWRSITHLTDAASTDPVYSIFVDADNYVYITFGDGVSGAIPATGADIRAQYYIGGGQVGNVAQGVLNVINYAPTGYDLTALEVLSSTTASGGADPESNASIRVNAPRSLTTLRRAVTLEDYGNLALNVLNVGKANATAASRTSVTLYVAPQQAATSTDLYPGYTDDPDAGGTTTVDWLAMKTAVEGYVGSKSQIGVSLTVSPPTYAPVSLGVRFSKLAQYTNEQVKANLMLELVNKFSYNYMSFEDVITPEEIEYQLRQVDGVYNVTVTSLGRVGQTGRNTLVGEPGEIFLFLEENLDVNPASVVSTLSNLTVSAGTLSPSFSSSSLNYNLPLPNGTTSITVTPTNSTATISVNGTTVASGSGTSVSTAVGTTVINVVVVAQDGITSSSYRITATRTS
jgi:hypothetical protein